MAPSAGWAMPQNLGERSDLQVVVPKVCLSILMNSFPCFSDLEESKFP